MENWRYGSITEGELPTHAIGDGMGFGGRENPLKNIYRGSQKFPEIINPVNTIMWNS